MQWWCAAVGDAWEWVWQPYPGVWIFVALTGFVYRRRFVAAAERHSPSRRAILGHGMAGAAGLALIWIALDWPVGALGAGYLASVHMVQYLLLALAAPPLLLLGLPVPRVVPAAMKVTPRQASGFRVSPVMALGLFVGVTAVTHIPAVVDRVMTSQIGNFALDISWLMSGLVFWWPIIPVQANGRSYPAPVYVLYLFPAMLTHTVIAVYLVFSRFPIYATYELAVPTGIVSALADQQIAGGLMWVGGTPVMWGIMGFVFYRWVGRDNAIAFDPPVRAP